MYHFLSGASAPRRARARVIRPRHGFTLLEILVVLAIIGLLAGLAIAKIDTIHRDAQIATTQIFVRQPLQLPLSVYRNHMNEYPSTAEGLQALVTAPAGRGDRWRGPYVDGGKVPRDPWGEPYHYAFPGVHNKSGFDVWSNGPDRVDGTPDDIGNWDEPEATPHQ